MQGKNGSCKKTFDVIKCFTPDGKGLRKQKFDQRDKMNSVAPTLLSPKPIALISNQSTPYSTTTDTLVPTKTIATKPVEAANGKDIDGKDALNGHLVKLRNQFTSMHGIANKKMFELQSELSKMQHMSREFDVLAEFLSSEGKLSIFEQNLDRLQKTVHLTEENIHEINTNNQKMGEIIHQINETSRKQHENNEKAINTIEERLVRWEVKLDRVARKMSNQKIDVSELKGNGGDYGQLKDDIENMLNGRLDELTQNIEWMKNIIFGIIIALLILKTIFIDFNQKHSSVVQE